MAKTLKCNSCGGTYPDTTEGGVTYFHVCPDQIVDDPGEVNQKTGEIIRPHTYKPTPNPRNENFIPHPDKPLEHVMISEGSGVTKVG